MTGSITRDLPVWIAFTVPKTKYRPAVRLATCDDIERSGAISVPEAQRLTTGLQVARLASCRLGPTA